MEGGSERVGPLRGDSSRPVGASNSPTRDRAESWGGPGRREQYIHAPGAQEASRIIPGTPTLPQEQTETPIVNTPIFTPGTVHRGLYPSLEQGVQASPGLGASELGLRGGSPLTSHIASGGSVRSWRHSLATSPEAAVEAAHVLWDAELGLRSVFEQGKDLALLTEESRSRAYELAMEDERAAKIRAEKEVARLEAKRLSDREAEEKARLKVLSAA